MSFPYSLLSIGNLSRLFLLVISSTGLLIGSNHVLESDSVHERWADPRVLLADVVTYLRESTGTVAVTDRSIAVYCKQETDFHQTHGLKVTLGSNISNPESPYYKIAIFEQGNALQPDGRVDSRALSITVEKHFKTPEITGKPEKARIKVRLCATRKYPLPTNFTLSVFDQNLGRFVTKGREIYPITFHGGFDDPVDVDGFQVDGLVTFREGLDYLLREITEKHLHQK